MSGSTHHDLTLFTFKEKSFPSETSFDDSSISRCESASSNPLLCVLATLGSLWGLCRRKCIVSCQKQGADLPQTREVFKQQKNKYECICKYTGKPKLECPSPSDCIRCASLADSLIASLSRSIITDTQLPRTFHFVLGTGKGTLWTPSCMTQFRS